MKGQAVMTNPNICTQKKCSYYGNIQNGTCNYRLKTGTARGCKINECDKFTTAKVKDKRSQITVSNKKPTNKKEKKVMPQKYDWITIFGRLSAGEDYGKVKAEIGFTDSAYYYARNYSAEHGTNRERLGSKTSPEPRKRAESAASPAPVRTPAQPGESPHSERTAAERPSKDKRTGVSNFRWYTEDLKRIADIAETIPENGSYKLYCDYAQIMQSVVKEMCEKRAERVGAVKRMMKEQGR